MKDTRWAACPAWFHFHLISPHHSDEDTPSHLIGPGSSGLFYYPTQRASLGNLKPFSNKRFFFEKNHDWKNARTGVRL